MRYALLLICLLISGCQILGPEEEETVVVDVPSGFESIPVPEHNPLTSQKVVLGERLFLTPYYHGINQLRAARAILPILLLRTAFP